MWVAVIKLEVGSTIGVCRQHVFPVCEATVDSVTHLDSSGCLSLQWEVWQQQRQRPCSSSPSQISGGAACHRALYQFVPSFPVCGWDAATHWRESLENVQQTSGLGYVLGQPVLVRAKQAVACLLSSKLKCRISCCQPTECVFPHEGPREACDDETVKSVSYLPAWKQHRLVRTWNAPM